MKILGLLKNENYTAWVQGNHTRLVISGKLFEVLSKGSIKNPHYNLLNYQGYSEEEAVATFMENEDT
jgi:hypothetical protein